MSDRIAVMNRGRIEQIGEPLALYERPATRFVAEFLGESNFFDGTVAADGVAGLRLLTGSGLRLPLPAGRARAGDAASLCLRPEKISLATDGGGLDGEVAEVIYLGEATRYVVRLASGELVTVKQQNLGPGATLKVGAGAGLAWDPDAAIVHAKGDA
jgi:ABC-type Fe3+/spermidine/putrescine transport system ATPase subunit